VHTAVVVKLITYERRIQCQTFATFPVTVVVEVCPERWPPTDIPSVIKTPKPSVCFRSHYRNTLNAAVTVLSVSKACCQFEAQFDANPSLLHISHFNMAVRWQNITNMTSQNAHTKHTRSHSWRPLGRLVHTENSYLAAHKCTTSGFRAAFQLQGLLGSISHNRLGSYRFPYFRFCYFGFRSYSLWNLPSIALTALTANYL
jgi:hypothetical protein